LQVEEQYSEAKQIYDELTDELYEELPSFYDRCEVWFLQLFIIRLLCASLKTILQRKLAIHLKSILLSLT